MENLLATIQAVLVPDATDEARASGASACRAILTALEATPGASMSAAISQPNAVAQIVGALRGMPLDQVLDIAIARLQAAVPADKASPPVRPLHFQMIPLGHLKDVPR